MPKEQRPEVLFAGNSALAQDVQTTLGSLANLHIAPNVRPSYESEQLTPSQPALARTYPPGPIPPNPGYSGGGFVDWE